MKQLGKAIDDIRAGEARRLRQDGYEPVLKHSRWCLLKRPENLTDRADRQARRIAPVQSAKRCGLTCIAKTSNASGSTNRPPGPAGSSTNGARRVMRSRLEPLKKVARSLRKHRALLLNWFRAKGTISAGIVEGFNNKAKLTMRKSYGFREYETIELALYHQLGNLPQPEFTHEFC